MSIRVFACIVHLFLGASAAVAADLAPPPAELAPGFHTIGEERAREWLGYLAGPECAGRGTGQEGYSRAAAFMAERFRDLGLKPIGAGGSYFQDVPFSRVQVLPDETWLEGPGGFRLPAGAGLGVSRASADFDFEGEVVFVRARGEDAKLPEGLELAGKAVVAVTADTSRGFQGGLFRADPAVFVSVSDRPSDLEPRIRAERPESRGRGGSAPRLTLTPDAAAALARMLGVDPALTVEPGADAPAFAAATGSGRITLRVRVKSESLSVPNVVGLLEGSDPARRNQHIAIGAHLDHMGVDNGQVFFGADDDASGNTALLLIAQGLAANPQRPARSVLFLAFCGEEMGLIGSRHYVENPLLPLSDMACLLQMDMVGRCEEDGDEKAADNLDTIHLVGSQRISSELHALTLTANESVGLNFEFDEERVYTRSDHYNFARQGVPITFLFSGFHPDYHQPTDTADKILFDKVVRAARLNYLTAHYVAALDHLPARDVKPEGGEED